jgi:hypothetical protein
MSFLKITIDFGAVDVKLIVAFIRACALPTAYSRRPNLFK